VGFCKCRGGGGNGGHCGAHVRLSWW
jgi:hypothetical protein